MRVVSGSIPRLLAAGILALVLGCDNGTSPNSNGDEVRYTIINHGSVDIHVIAYGSGNTKSGYLVGPGESDSRTALGSVGDNIRFEIETTTISTHIKLCQAGAPIVSVGGTPQPPALYGQVDVNVFTTTMDIDCTGGVGEWL